MCYLFTRNICSAHNPKQVVVFCKHVFVEQTFKFSHFEGSVIP